MIARTTGTQFDPGALLLKSRRGWIEAHSLELESDSRDKGVVY